MSQKKRPITTCLDSFLPRKYHISRESFYAIFFLSPSSLQLHFRSGPPKRMATYCANWKRRKCQWNGEEIEFLNFCIRKLASTCGKDWALTTYVYGYIREHSWSVRYWAFFAWRKTLSPFAIVCTLFFFCWESNKWLAILALAKRDLATPKIIPILKHCMAAEIETNDQHFGERAKNMSVRSKFRSCVRQRIFDANKKR